MENIFRTKKNDKSRLISCWFKVITVQLTWQFRNADWILKRILSIWLSRKNLIQIISTIFLLLLRTISFSFTSFTWWRNFLGQFVSQNFLFTIENVVFVILSLIEFHICLTTSVIYSQNKILDHVLESLIKSENADEKIMFAWKCRTSSI